MFYTVVVFPAGEAGKAPGAAPGELGAAGPGGLLPALPLVPQGLDPATLANLMAAVQVHPQLQVRRICRAA